MLSTIIPSYLYVEYNDDENLQALVDAYNTLAQEYLDSINGLNLPIYTAPSISGLLLDWVGNGLYGMPRPVISGEASAALGPYNTWTYNTLTYNGAKLGAPAPFYGASDDLYKRILTWNFYKGDGTQTTIPWLKRRVHRFLNGENGTQTANDQTYDVSVTFTGDREILIEVPTTNPFSAVLQQCSNLGLLQYPLQWAVTVTPVAPTFPPINTAIPVVTGDTDIGSTLTTTNGTWDNDPTLFTYQWTNTTTGDIPGATADTYVAQSSDNGDEITCTVTAGNGAGTASATSDPVGPIGVNPYDLLLPFTTASGITDKGKHSIGGISITGTAAIQNTVSKWGEGAISFPGGNNQYLEVPPTADLIPATGAFTMAAWVNWVDNTQLNITWDWADSADTTRVNGFCIYTPSEHISMYHGGAGYFDSAVPANNTWYFMAVCRDDAGNMSLWLNGVQIDTAMGLDFNLPMQELLIGGTIISNPYGAQCFMNDFYVKIGVDDFVIGEGPYAVPTGPLSF
jgi:hypothetical protein